MDYKKTKIGKFFLGKGFYGVLAICLIAVGMAAWSAFDRVSSAKPNTAETPDTSAEQITSSENTNPENEVKAEAQSKIPYSSEEVSSEQSSQPSPVVAYSFTSPLSGGIIKPYSDTELIYSATFSDMRTHLGLDIEGELGCDIRSCGNGTVSGVSNDSLLGKYVEIDHGNGVTSKYYGLDSVFVSVGETVSATTCIGLLGDIPSESEDMTHLHLEFYLDGKLVDPQQYIS